MHSDEFKANAVASCMQPGISMAAVAMANGINANLLRRWVQAAEMRPGSVVPDAPPAPKRQGAKTPAAFVPMQLPAGSNIYVVSTTAELSNLVEGGVEDHISRGAT
nr:transposase [Acidovorax sp. JG5]